MTEVLRKLKDADGGAQPVPLPPPHLAALVRMVEEGAISGRTAKDVFERMWATGEAPAAIVAREGLTQVSDEDALQEAVEAVLAQSPGQVATYRAGKAATLGWFVGQVMRRTGGKANPQVVQALLKKALDR
jgi:aspartyl-tRNA(Asn)/glutamyl-tRNA(Gln) amidotransferase subunit B